MTDEIKAGLRNNKITLPFRYHLPLVTPQTNEFDCGVLVCIYMQKWFEQGRPKMHAAATKLKEWFKPYDVYRMRYDL